MTANAATPFPGMDAMPNWSESLDEFWKRVMAAPKVAELAQRTPKGCTQSEVVGTVDQIRVLRYTEGPPREFATPLIVVFALINRPYILDLMPNKSVVGHFLRKGFDVYLVDWGVPSYGDRHRGLEYYVQSAMQRIVDLVRRRTQQKQVNILGYCMGGTMSAMFTALHPDTVRNLILMAAPFDFSQRESLLSVWCDEKYFDVDAFIEAYGNAPPWYLQFNFQLLKPVSNFLEKYVNLYDKMTDETYVQDFVAMEQWLNDNIPVAGETFRQFVRYGFQQNLLVKGRWPIGEQQVNLERIACPVLNLMASADHLVPCEQSRGFTNLVGSKDRETIEFPAGHIGLAVGSKAQKELWPRAAEWLAKRTPRLR